MLNLRLNLITILIFSYFISLSGQNIDYSVRKIYSSNHHNAFTSLIKFKNKYYCTFRSGEHHVHGKDGVTKIIVSEDAINWHESATLKKLDIDLRDPKLSITPEGKIMVIIGGSDYEGKTLVGRMTYVAFSDTLGEFFSDPIPVIIDPEIRTDNDWLWRVTWHQGMAYGVLYQGSKPSTSLIRSTDGIHYKLVCVLNLDGRPNEATVRFDEEGKMYILHRREEGDKMGVWGSSPYPYSSWKWEKMEERIGGPDFEILPDGSVLAGCRIYRSEGAYVGILKGTKEGLFENLLQLPSGGDCSYPGFVVEPHRILVSYYSSHEGSTDIYLAEIGR